MNTDTFKLMMPAKAEYLLALRMYVAAIASRHDQDIDTLEDLKAGVAEACILILNQKRPPKTLSITITVGDSFAFNVRGEGEGVEQADIETSAEADELAKCLIDTFFDESNYVYEESDLKEVVINKHL